MKFFTEGLARLFVLGVLLGLLLAIVAARGLGQAGVVEIHARLPEKGGWSPTDLTAQVGEPLHLRLTSDDAVHGFAVGQMNWPEIEIKPGQVTETTLIFDQPGKYTFYCTRWCGVNHWRMRGTIEVGGSPTQAVRQPAPLYVQLGLDIDADHHAEAIPQMRPLAARGAPLGGNIPASYLTLDYYRTHSPAQAWQSLRDEPFAVDLDDQQVWDLVAFIWQSNATSQALYEGQRLYAANCAACHGEAGAGDGVMAQSMATPSPGAIDDHAETKGHEIAAPTNFTDATHLLGASPAILHGKIVRGGMGTGMPYWGPIFTDEQVWSLVTYLWTFQFDDGGLP